MKTNTTTNMTTNMTGMKNEKILLLLLPYWSPLIPPLGLGLLKGFLQARGYNVKTVDVNIEKDFRDLYEDYLNTLKAALPADKQGNFFNVGNDVLRNHFMAHINKENERDYLELVGLLVRENFFCTVPEETVGILVNLADSFFAALETFLTDLFKREKPGVLGISVFNGSLAASCFAFQQAKTQVPGVCTLMGGGVFADDLALGSPNLEFFLHNTPYIDHLFIGEGEHLLYEYLQGRLPESQRVYTLDDVQGRLLELADADMPDFSDLQLIHYPNMASYASRSCPFNCSFCSETVRWGKFRKRPASRVVDELLQLHRAHGNNLFLMGDSLLNPVVHELSRELEHTGATLYWDGYLRADKPVCKVENTLLWRRGGFYRARLGLESGSQHVLDLMGKKINPGQIKQAVSSLAFAGIKTTTYWVIGHPGETEEDFSQTLALIEELKDDIYEADCNPFNYYYSGQVESQKWAQTHNRKLLYPESATDMLMVRTWYLDTEPSRQVIYERVERFIEHCLRLGIPNPYSLHDIYRADERWKKLQANAVPSLVELRPEYATGDAVNLLDDKKKVKNLRLGKNIPKDDGDWGF